MRIEEITFDEKKFKFHIIVDGRSFYVPYSFYEKYQLHTDMELTQEAVEELQQITVFEKAYDDALHFLSYRIRTEKEVYQKLKKKKIPEIYIEQIIEKLKSLSFLDDTLFCKTFIQEKIRLTNWSKARIKQELYAKGISYSQEELDALYPLEMEFDKAEKIIEKKIDAWKRKYKEEYQLQGKIYQYLSTRGFQYDTIAHVKELF